MVAPFQRPHLGRSVWQLVNTLVPLVVLYYLMYKSLSISYWLTLGLSVLAAGFMVRSFIIFHDCGHYSFFKSRQANNIWGYLTGVLIWTPSYHWSHEHAEHHACAGDLDHRGVGDIWTMTVKEYCESPRWKKILYRIIRHPLFLFVLAPFFIFTILHRIPSVKGGKRALLSTHSTNLGILVTVVTMSYLIGLKSYMLIQIPITAIASSVGIWMFYVQHQFEGVYWERNPKWDYVTEALQGSSFYKLPKVLQWFTGNIGFHHIHHLSPRIPNYYLEPCYNANPLFQQIKPITLFSSFKSLRFRLWDEEKRQLVGFDYLKKIRPVAA